MTRTEAMRELKAFGTAQNRKVYGRHGVEAPMFGVSYAHLGKLKRRIKIDHALAVELWDTGNHDARVLATMVADPDAVRASELDRWVRDLDDHVLASAFADLAARTRHARKRMERWTGTAREWVATAGWNVLSRIAERDDLLTEDDLAPYLEAIEARIHTAANRVRYSMNSALIAIALRSPALRRQAVAAARRIGPVEVDHGETGCKTPDAASYITKAVEHRRKKATRKKKASGGRKTASKKKTPRRKKTA